MSEQSALYVIDYCKYCLWRGYYANWEYLDLYC